MSRQEMSISAESSHEVAMRSSYASIVIVICLFVLVGRSYAFDVDQFLGLPQKDKVDIIVAALNTRQATLANMEYSVDCQTTLDFTASTVTWPSKNRFEIKRRDGAKLVHRDANLSNGKFKYETWESWDGSVSTSRFRDGKIWRGAIRDNQSGAATGIAFEHMLGFTRPDGMSVTKWFEVRSKDAGTKIEFSKDEKSLIRVVATIFIEQETYLLDPEKDFAIVEHRYDYERNGAFNRTRTTVKEFKKFGEVWMPAEVWRDGDTSAVPGASRDVAKLDNCTFGSVSAKDASVQFENGTEFVDEIRNKAYRRLADGSDEQLPMYDGATGKMVMPATKPSTAPTTQLVP
jgi:hypothetical protein